ncbi:hypothetical protein [Streptomyces goshikiensis]|uniref:hypothetical protein n=1 Tax=Streptomyces goshikiensis TaxID=1942 RepID=UPI0037210A8B
MPQDNQRHTEFLGVWLTPEDHRKLMQMVEDTQSNKAIVTRRALNLLYEKQHKPKGPKE